MLQKNFEQDVTFCHRFTSLWVKGKMQRERKQMQRCSCLSKERTFSMEDNEIIELYWQRDQRAIFESQSKYQRYCSVIADNILNCREDTEECVEDTWMRAWGSIPPNRPSRLRVFLGKITRNLAIDRYRRRKAAKYGEGQIALCLDELAECIGTDESIVDDIALKEALNGFLRGLNRQAREIFMLRYWYMFSVKDAARCCNTSEGAMKMSLKRTREKLRDHLEKEGFVI